MEKHQNKTRISNIAFECHIPTSIAENTKIRNSDCEQHPLKWVLGGGVSLARVLVRYFV
jgi:hypothetical protein